MTLSIKTNLASLNAQRSLAKTNSSLSTSLSKLSSGLRVRSAADDAAGLAISEKMKAQIRSMKQAERNANDGISLIQTADGALDEVHGIMQRLRELAVQSANGTYTSDDRSYLNNEFSQLVSEVSRIAKTTEFNGQNLLDGSLASTNSVKFQVGIENTANDRISIAIDAMTGGALGTTATGLNAASISTVTKALSTIDVIDSAIDQISSQRSSLGAVQNRLSVTVSNLASYRENLSAANSQIRDVDVAEETANMTRLQILMQAGVSVLAQANQMPSVAMALIS